MRLDKYHKMFYVLANEIEKPKFDAHIEAALLNSKGELIASPFGKGISIAENYKFNFFLKINDAQSKPGRLRDCVPVLLYNNEYVFLVSQKLKSLLVGISGNENEYFRVSFDFNGKTFGEYYLVNILPKLDCLNYLESDITFDNYDENDFGSGDIVSIESLVLEESLIRPDIHMFLLWGIDAQVVIVSAQLKVFFEKEKISGPVFKKIEEFQI